MENIVLYSTGCPRCVVLKKKLDSKGIVYTENNSVDDMVALGISAVPVLSVNTQLMDFSDPDLEKFYYLIHNEEMSNDDGKKVTYGNAVHYTDALRRLRNAKKYETYTSDEQRKYAQYLDMVTNWRNDQAHTAPTASEQEINAAISIVVAMYLYITGDSITDLEMSGYASEPTAPYNENEETAPLMAAEP